MFEDEEKSDSIQDNSVHTPPKKLIFPFKNKNRENRGTKRHTTVTFDKMVEFNLKKNNINLSESQSFDDPEHLELQLSFFYENLILLYQKKLYNNILQEFDGKEELLFKDSKMSFNIYILKIKCLFKLLKSRFEESLNTRGEIKNFFEVDKLINNINSDFKKINLIINENDCSEYEIITQIYCKFLLILSVIKSKKEESIEGFLYLNFGINMMKIYFIRQKIANDVKTYLIYARLLILFINQIVSDNNYNQALMYINLLLKICEIASVKIKKQKLNSLYQIKFIQIAGYAFLFSGYCFEINNNYDIVLRSYKQAYYFFSKHDITTNDMANVFFYSKITELIKITMHKVNRKLIKEEIERRRKNELEEIHKKEAEHQKEKEEKRFLLKLIASGFPANIDKFSHIQKKLYDNILTSKNQRIMEKLDDELISVVYKNQNNKIENNDLSMNTKRNLCHYEIYNKLMTNKFKDYVTKNNKFGFSNPQLEKNSLDSIQGYLNNKMKINLKSNVSPYTMKKYKMNQKLKIKGINTISNNDFTSRNFSTDNKTKNTESTNSYNNYLKTNITTERSVKENYKNKRNNNNAINFEGYLSQTYRPKSKNYNNQNYYPIISSSSDVINNKTNSLTFNKKSIKKNVSYDYNTKSEKINNIKKTPITNNKINLNGLSKSYFKKYCYLDSLACKDLKFQKTLLSTKSNNAKLYFSDFDSELSNSGRIQKEDVYKRYLVIKDKANSKFKEYKTDDIIKFNNLKNDQQIIGNIFKSFSLKFSQGKSAKNAMSKVISRYINEKKNEKKALRFIDKEKVLKKNQDFLMDLNNGIKEINYMLQLKTEDIKKTK